MELRFWISVNLNKLSSIFLVTRDVHFFAPIWNFHKIKKLVNQLFTSFCIYLQYEKAERRGQVSNFFAQDLGKIDEFSYSNNMFLHS
jgi:hypothetical protein